MAAITSAIVALSFGLVPAAAQGQLSWSSPVAIAHGANATDGLNAISCPSASQCTAAGSVGQVVTFNPAAPGTPEPAPIDDGRYIVGVACPAATQCTGVDTTGDVVTFNPTSPGTPAPAAVDPSGFPSAISCPTVSQCTVVDESGDAVTFSPASPTATAKSLVVSADSLLLGVSCPATTQCTAVDAGDSITFDPATGTILSDVTIDANDGLRGVACPTTGQCTAIDQNGTEYTLNVPSGGKPSSSNIDDFDDALAGIACPTTTQCVVVGTAAEVTFDPTQPTPSPSRVLIDSGESLNGVSCSATGECAAIDGDGQVVGFPAATGSPASVAPAGGDPIAGLGCPTATQCTASDATGAELTFQVPLSGTPTPEIVGQSGIGPLACPAANQCTAIAINGGVVTFDPQSSGSPAPAGSETGNVIACSSASQCTAVTSGTRSIAIASTFEPSSPASSTTVSIHMSPINSDRGTTTAAVVCPSVAQCTVVDTNGEAATFDPATSGTVTATTIDTHALTGVACPSQSQCTAVDTAGNAVTFAPADPSTAATAPIATGQPLTGVSCPTTAWCVAVSSDGNAFEGDPGAGQWITEPVGGPLSAVACPSPSGCVAVDTLGRAAIATAPPTGTGTVTPGDVGTSTPPSTGGGPVDRLSPGGFAGARSATFIGVIGATGGQPVHYHFEYGTTTAYGSATPDRTVTPGSAGITVRASVGGLARFTTYHYRLVALTCAASACTSDSGDQTVTTGLALSPVLDRTVGVGPISGIVLVRLRGHRRFVRLRAGELIAVGSRVDVTHGVVLLISATAGTPHHDASGQFSRGVFTVQQRSAATTTLDLDSNYAACRASTPARTAAVRKSPPPKRKKKKKTKTVNQVFGTAHGGYTTRGTYSTAADQGTGWLTADRCDGTLVRVTVGVVIVHDLRHHRILRLHAGQQHLS